MIFSNLDSFCPTDSKFVSCSDDGTLRIFDFLRCQEERVMRGHGADVKCVHWHPTKSLIVSGSKDNQQPIKLWDPKCGQALATLHAHKSTVMDLKWNDNGNWLITASRDHLLKLFDLRNLKEDLQTFRGHKKEASAVTWHPVHEGLFTSGGSDGQILFWNVGTDKEIGGIEAAHESIVWTLAWHPIGHILCSGSNDHTVKFWTRSRPGDSMRDKYNLNTLPPSLAGLEDYEMDDHISIPGMGGIGVNDDRLEFGDQPNKDQPPNFGKPTISISDSATSTDHSGIPGLDLDISSVRDKSLPSSQSVSRKSVQSEAKENFYGTTACDSSTMLSCIRDILSRVINTIPGLVALNGIQPEKLQIYGKEIDVIPGSKLHGAILGGFDTLYEYIHSGDLDELDDVIPYEDFLDYTAEDFIQDHAVVTVGDPSEDPYYCPDEVYDDDESEPSSKRFKADVDCFDNDGSNDYDVGANDPGIPSLLNLNLEPPRSGQEKKNVSQKSPTVSPWESTNQNNGAAPASSKDRKTRSSRWR